MHMDVLIVGAGPTGLMLANQLARRGVRAMIVDRHSGRRSRHAPWPCRRARSRSTRRWESSTRHSPWALSPAARTCGQAGAGRRAFPIGDIGSSMSPFPFILMLGQDDNERIMGEKLRSPGVDVQWNTELVAFEQHPDHVDVTLKQPDGTHLEVTATLGCRLRRFAQRRSRDERHHLSRRAVRARVLRRRHRGDRGDEAGRAERLSLARRIPPVLSDAWQGPLARDRYPSAGDSATATI